MSRLVDTKVVAGRALHVADRVHYALVDYATFLAAREEEVTGPFPNQFPPPPPHRP